MAFWSRYPFFILYFQGELLEVNLSLLSGLMGQTDILQGGVSRDGGSDFRFSAACDRGTTCHS